ncbi:IS3 family transposase [Schleiferilactobacillus harbinensis]|uniref:IS3 family transposase n=2 Tax=Schleiferilactobacillus harbinensis TaxID=304207 RepID=A0A5P8M2C2_9LACO|nr:IS3 family transposase [Schleiferilactobacillus harbinensis]QFR22648.1 IS3 family transposase [Schleiferilactobacillus harbinensis]QFR23346.1 IS3 family transposase [Schleiferilactobacillus harbinensis]
MEALAKEVNLDTKQPYGISFACRFLEISRAAFYKWRNRKPSVHAQENKEIAQYIKVLEEDNHYIFGVRRLAIYINRETRFHVGATRVRNIMHKNHIVAAIRVAKRDRKAEKKEYFFANKLLTNDTGHDFSPERPNMVWVTDCSELTYGDRMQYRLRLSAVKDLFDHSIVAWRVSPTETTLLVTNTVETALKNTGGIKPEILHSDQGSAYTSRGYNMKLAGLGITHSMSRPGTPGDNSPMESFWSHMKTEFFRFEHALSELKMMQLIQRCVDWYNNKRRQETLNGMTPLEYRNHAVKEIA